MVYVDENCIGCGVCENMAWSIFKVEGGFSHVIKQPETQEEITSTQDAIWACPVVAIKEGAPITNMSAEDNESKMAA